LRSVSGSVAYGPSVEMTMGAAAKGISSSVNVLSPEANVESEQTFRKISGNKSKKSRK
jgi:hypothetical protein